MSLQTATPVFAPVTTADRRVTLLRVTNQRVTLLRVQFVGLSHLGTNDFLRMRLRTHLNAIKADDMEIKAEGGAAVLTDDELRSACRSRGMSAPFGSGCTELMRKNLCDWMELSLERCAPLSLLSYSADTEHNNVLTLLTTSTMRSMHDSLSCCRSW